MLKTDSSRVIFEEGNVIDNTNDAFYVINGIITEMQKIGDKYVILGELRGDLMTTTDFSSSSLKEINEFNVSSGNEYLDKRDYYNVINNCNYAIQRMDTSIFLRNEKVLMPAFVTAKTFRAWTYMQMALVYGKVSYIEEPILNLEASLKEYPVVGIDELIDKLIADLSPYTDVPYTDLYIPVHVILGDLYLFRNDYEQAARMYHHCLINGSSPPLVVTSTFVNRWSTAAYETVVMNHQGGFFGESLFSIYYSDEVRDLHSDLVRLTYNNKPSLVPSAKYIESMRTAIYCFATQLNGNVTSYTEGDLRGNMFIQKTGMEYGDAFVNVDINGVETPLIYKFYFNANVSSEGSDPDNQLISNGLRYLTRLPIFSVTQLYLRYAEAVNRAGKPSLAFAALKYGLTNNNIHDPSKVNPSEIVNGESYLDFQHLDFDNNVAIAVRGRGFGIPRDTRYFIIPDFTRYVDGVDESGNPVRIPSQNSGDLQAALQDSIEWVEVKILEELAAERPFEGSRFFDLMRVSRRRANHPEFMAEKVSSKYQNPSGMKAKLMNIDTWFLP
jgi:tetratricopeptide (TPR) repeat protein